MKPLSRFFQQDDSHTIDVVRGSSVAFAVRVTGWLCAYGFALILAHAYGAWAVGIYSLALAVLTVTSLPASLGFRVSILRFVPEYLAQGKGSELLFLYRRMLQAVVPVSVLFGALIFVFAGVLAERVFGNPSYVSALRIAGTIVPFFTIGMMNVEAVRGFKNLALSESLRDICIPVVAITVLLLLREHARTTILPIVSHAAGVGVMLTLSTIYLIQRLRGLQKKGSREAPMGTLEMVKISLPMMLGELSTILMGRIDTVMLGMLAATEQVGLYAVVFKIGVLPGFIPAAVATIMAPKSSALHWSGKHDELKRLIRLSSGLMFWSSGPVLVLLVLAPRFWLGLFGAEFTAGAPALVLVAFCPFVVAASGFVGTFLNMSGKQNVYRNIIVTAVVLNVLLNYFFIPAFGVTGAAVASLVTTLFWNLTGVIYVRRVFGINMLYFLPQGSHPKTGI